LKTTKIFGKLNEYPVYQLFIQYEIQKSTLWKILNIKKLEISVFLKYID